MNKEIIPVAAFFVGVIWALSVYIAYMVGRIHEEKEQRKKSS